MINFLSSLLAHNFHVEILLYNKPFVLVILPQDELTLALHTLASIRIFLQVSLVVGHNAFLLGLRVRPSHLATEGYAHLMLEWVDLKLTVVLVLGTIWNQH